MVKKIARSLACLFSLSLLIAAVASAPSALSGAQLPGEGKTVLLGHSGSENQYFQALVIVRGLQKLGYEIGPFQETKYPALYLAIANGDVQFMAQNWDPLHDAFFEKAGGDAKMSRVGHLIKGALQGYVIDKKTAEKHKITNIDQMKDPKIKALFDTDGDGKANLLGCNPGWGCESAIEEHMDAYKLREHVSHDQGSYFALVPDVLARYRNGEPVLYFTWTPMWINQLLVPERDVAWLEVPEPRPSPTGFGVNENRVVANNDFLKENAAAKRFFELAEIPIGAVNGQNLRIYEGEEGDEEHRATHRRMDCGKPSRIRFPGSPRL